MYLTKTIRGRIADAVVDRAFKTRREKLREQEEHIADKVYRAVVPVEVEKALNALAAVVESDLGGAEVANYVKDEVAVRAHMIADRSGMGVPMALSTKRKSHPYGNLYYKAERGNVLGEQVDAHLAAIKKFNADKKQARDETLAALGAFKTYKQLQEGWPEIMSIADSVFENYCGHPSSNLPMVQLSMLNDKLDLPPEQKQEAA